MSLFDSGDTSSFVVSFGDPKGHFSAFAKGYTLAANRLAAALLERGRFSDYEAYPVVYLYRHAFELSLKHIIYGGVELAAFRQMDEVNEQLHNNHNLSVLSQTAVKILSLLFPNDQMLASPNRTVAEVSDAWSKIDPRSDAYRYPIDTRGQPSTKPNQTVSLRELSTRMAALLEDLDTVHFGLNIETDKAQSLYTILAQFIPSGRAH